LKGFILLLTADEAKFIETGKGIHETDNQGNGVKWSFAGR